MTRRGLALALASLLLAGCTSTESKLTGTWETVDTPKRSLDLRKDQTYAYRLSGKTLGFLSDLAGAETGTWKVEDKTLVLTHGGSEGAAGVQITRLAIGAMDESSVVLGPNHWVRLAR